MSHMFGGASEEAVRRTMYERDCPYGVLRRYLLGAASEREQEMVEHAMLADENFYEELLTMEDELIDECVSRQLPEAERTRFFDYVKRLPDHKQRLAFARALRWFSLNLRAELQNTHDDRQGPN